MAKILIVEDDAMLGLSMQTTFESRKHVAELVSDGNEAIDRLKLYSYEVVILDWNLPGASGIEICKFYRGRGGAAPILMLTGKDQITDKEIGFQSGVDDYLTKPFDMRELLARLDALLRRSHVYKEETFTAKGVELNTRTRIVTKDGATVPVSATELAVLEFLFRRRGQFFTVTDLLNEVWATDSDSSELAVRQCISRLRKKLDTPGHPPLIETSKGLGYRIEG